MCQKKWTTISGRVDKNRLWMGYKRSNITNERIQKAAQRM